MARDQQSDLTLLAAIMDCLIPGDDLNWPAAGTHGLAGAVMDHLTVISPDLDAFGVIMELLDIDFQQYTAAQQEAVLRQCEHDEPDAFDVLVRATYNMYYTDAAVRKVIEHMTGYPARPPQPDGYVMEPFDESLLDVVRQQGPSWRKA